MKEIVSNPDDVPGNLQVDSQQENGWRWSLLGHSVWISSESSLGEIEKLRRWFPEVVRLLEEAI